MSDRRRYALNLIWIVVDTLRRDHLGCYGNRVIRTPAINSLASRSVRFDAHYAAGFPTMPTRADHATGRWTISRMGWEPLPDDMVTLAQLLSGVGYHTAAITDTPFYTRHGMNYDRGFQTFVPIAGQGGGAAPNWFMGRQVQEGFAAIGSGHHESWDVRERWRLESDRNTPRTMTAATEWLEYHYKERFFLYVDTWDPHEPWDAPPYYTELYMPDYDGEIVNPIYARWPDDPALSERKIEKAHASYSGEITMVDTWLGYLLSRVENMGLMESTAVVFTSDHGFYFGEHGGFFGKMSYAKRPDGTLYKDRDPDAQWAHSPLYQELVALPLLVYVPGTEPGSNDGLSSAIDLMPTALDVLGEEVPDWVEGRSLLPAARDASHPGREYTVSTIPFANPGDRVRSVDDVSRPLTAGLVTTVTAGEWSLLFSTEPGLSELYHLPSDPDQEHNVIERETDTARELHGYLMAFMRDTNVAEGLVKPRQELRL